MAEEQDGGEKEFDASDQRLKQAREEGNVPPSKETNALAIVLAIIGSAYIYFAVSGEGMAMTLFGAFHHADSFSDDIFKSDGSQTRGWVIQFLIYFLPLVGLLMVAVIGAIIVSKSYSFSLKKIKPDIKKISPVDNLKKKYGKQGMTDFLKDAAKMIFAGIISVFFLLGLARDYFGASALQEGMLAGFAFEQTLNLIFAFALFQFVLAAIDFPLQQSIYAENLKMTREEVKKEFKQNEGDPMLKQQRRQKARQITNGEMMKNVESATVIMVNPTHYAVALSWDPEAQNAPVVVAKGVDHIAARIREIATAHKVPIYSDPPSTRAIYAAVEIDEEIQPEHFAAVAAAIQYVERIRAAYELSSS